MACNIQIQRNGVQRNGVEVYNQERFRVGEVS